MAFTEFPWDALKAETLRSLCRDLGAHPSKVKQTRDGMLGFLRLVEQKGHDAALQIVEGAEEPPVGSTPSAARTTRNTATRSSSARTSKRTAKAANSISFIAPAPASASRKRKAHAIEAEADSDADAEGDPDPDVAVAGKMNTRFNGKRQRVWGAETGVSRGRPISRTGPGPGPILPPAPVRKTRSQGPIRELEEEEEEEEEPPSASRAEPLSRTTRGVSSRTASKVAPRARSGRSASRGQPASRAVTRAAAAATTTTLSSPSKPRATRASGKEKENESQKQGPTRASAKKSAAQEPARRPTSTSRARSSSRPRPRNASTSRPPTASRSRNISTSRPPTASRTRTASKTALVLSGLRSRTGGRSISLSKRAAEAAEAEAELAVQKTRSNARSRSRGTKAAGRRKGMETKVKEKEKPGRGRTRKTVEKKTSFRPASKRATAAAATTKATVATKPRKSTVARSGLGGGRKEIFVGVELPAPSLGRAVTSGTDSERSVAGQVNGLENAESSGYDVDPNIMQDVQFVPHTEDVEAQPRGDHRHLLLLPPSQPLSGVNGDNLDLGFINSRGDADGGHEQVQEQVAPPFDGNGQREASTEEQQPEQQHPLGEGEEEFRGFTQFDDDQDLFVNLHQQTFPGSPKVDHPPEGDFSVGASDAAIEAHLQLIEHQASDDTTIVVPPNAS